MFNRDDTGLPQNEESVTSCKNRRNIVEGGINDYRGLLDPQGNFTGWHLSTDGGKTVANEGLLPPLTVAGTTLPSGGDPVSQSDGACNIYMASLNYGPDPFNEGVNGVGLYKTTPERLRNCPQGEDPANLTHPSCWPTRRLVATAEVAGGVGHFLDKEWFDVGRSGSAGKVVWVAYADFALDPSAPLGFTGAQIKAVRCSADLVTCTQPILISGSDADTQFADVTISDRGATLITWAQVEGELEQTAQTFTIKARIAPPGSTNFGPTRIVSRETNPVPFGGALHANDFRIATIPKSIMPTVNGEPRPTVVWERCRFRLLDTICEEPQIVISSSRDNGRTWSQPRIISQGGDNYFPAISDETGNPRFVVAYFTNRNDRIFHNRQDVEMVTINPVSGSITKRQRVTSVSNESEADPILGGFFIGDYIDVHLAGDRAYVAYNANYRHVPLLGQGLPIPQQDNYLTTVRR
ncbi:MAG: exo-alpha-sialidase [Nocardioidaceae bacterium]|nr:exo-alpha-sialidase [Nocardioidaceae bacterium]